MSTTVKKAPYNYFYMLDSDSDEETPPCPTPSPEPPCAPTPTPELPKPVLKDIPVEPQPSVRVWDTNDTSRFKKDNTNVFSSPFSRKKPKWSGNKQEEDWSRLRPEEIQPIDTNSFETFLTRGSGLLNLEIESDTTSLEWAERIKDTFERHESKRMSFFKT